MPIPGYDDRRSGKVARSGERVQHLGSDMVAELLYQDSLIKGEAESRVRMADYEKDNKVYTSWLKHH